MIDNRYYKKLKMQLNFLHRSCISYDQGFQDESFRIAVVLRVLFHNTKNSTSLLNHLQCEYIPLLSTKAYTSKEFIDAAGVYLGLIQIRGEGLFPKLGTGPRNREVEFQEWWEEIVLVPSKGYHFSRRKLVLEMANKDGGAHIDEKISPEYELITKGVGEFHKIDNKGNETIEKIENMHLITIRQIAFEVLNSRHLIGLLR